MKENSPMEPFCDCFLNTNKVNLLPILLSADHSCSTCFSGSSVSLENSPPLVKQYNVVIAGRPWGPRTARLASKSPEKTMGTCLLFR